MITMAAGKGVVKRLQWDVENMAKALEAVKLHNEGLRQAARQYDVPSQLLKDE